MLQYVANKELFITSPWGTSTIANQSTQTMKVFHLKQFAIYGIKYSMQLNPCPIQSYSDLHLVVTGPTTIDIMLIKFACFCKLCVCELCICGHKCDHIIIMCMSDCVSSQDKVWYSPNVIILLPCQSLYHINTPGSLKQLVQWIIGSTSARMI